MNPSILTMEKERITKMNIKIKEKINQLKKLYSKHVSFISFDGKDDLKNKINSLTKEITDLIMLCQQAIIDVKNINTVYSSNIQKPLAVELRDISDQFRITQQQYVAQIERRDNEANKYNPFEDEITASRSDASEYSQDLIGMDYTSIIQERTQQIITAHDSINEINEIFMALDTIILDQGTLIDRIDYQIEHAVHDVEKGKEQIIESKKLQASLGRKYICMLLVIIVIGLVIGVIVVHTLKH
jgi:syntaxin 16